MNTDTAILLLLAELQSQIISLKSEIIELRTQVMTATTVNTENK